MRLFISFAFLAMLGCGDDHDHDHGDTALSCQNIIDVCHDVDPGSGPITDCHETAHDEGTAAACDPIETMCVALCEAAAMDTDGGHEDHDAGHEDHDAE